MVAKSDSSYNFGYSHFYPIFYLLPSISTLINIFMIYWYLKTIYYSPITQKEKDLLSRSSQQNQSESNPEKESSNDDDDDKRININANSLDRMIFLLTIIETVVAITWLVNVSLFKTANNLSLKCRTCFFFSLYTIFLMVFDWTFFACCLYNLKSIIQNPIQETTFSKRVKIYLMISFFTAVFFTMLVLISGSYGVSPMLTCFISNGSNNPNVYNSSRRVTLYIILLIPIAYAFYITYIFFSLYRIRKLLINISIKIATFKMMVYSCLYALFYFPTFGLYIATIDTPIISPSVLSWLSYYCSLGGLMMTFCLGVGRAIERFSKWSLKDFSIFHTDDNMHHSKNNCNMYMLNSISIVHSFIRDIFSGIIMRLLIIKESQNLDNNAALKRNDILEEVESVFDSLSPGSNSTYFDQLKKFQSSDEEDPLLVTVIEHAPRIFKRIRMLEGVSEDDIINSLSTANIKSLTKGKGGLSGALFLPTADNQYLIKTMEEEDFESIMNDNFLTYYYTHLKNYPESVICRFFGLFSIKTESSSLPFRLILMRNAKGPFQNLIRLTYDLKGSTMNREIIIPEAKKNTSDEYFEVRKDVNFTKELKSMNLADQPKFIETIQRDVLFFEDMGIMDYSLFVYQIQYTQSELNCLHENEIFKFYSKHFYEAKQVGDANTTNNAEGIKIGYIIMIIDYLQKYTLNKKFEQGFKGIFKKGVASSAPPAEYCVRFLSFCKTIA